MVRGSHQNNKDPMCDLEIAKITRSGSLFIVFPANAHPIRAPTNSDHLNVPTGANECLLAREGHHVRYLGPIHFRECRQQVSKIKHLSLILCDLVD